jgi:hypothetical protein
LTQNHNWCCGLAIEDTAVRRDKSNRLGPPIGFGAVRNKAIDQRLIEFTGAYQVATQFSNRVNPIVGPERAAVVNRGFRRTADIC